MIRKQKVNPKRVDFKVGKYRGIKVLKTNTQIRTKICSHRIKGCSIERIDADHYRVKRTGKIKEIKHGTKRTDNVSSIAQSMSRLRDIINVNVSSDNIENIRWVTLTYKENMTDVNRLYTDFKKFMQRLRYWCEKQGLGRPEYIGAVEPQQRGAYHWHLLLIWQTTAPFIPNGILAEIWGNGFVSIKALDKNCSNIGLYLSAYLSDLDLSAAIAAKTDLSQHSLKQVSGKRYVKGSRLHLYPKGFRLYRLSKGIKRPQEYTMFYHELLDMLDEQDAELSYESLVYLYDDKHVYSGFSTLVQTRYYDITAPAKQRSRLYKACRIGKYYRTLYEEMLVLSQECSEYQEYRNEDELYDLFQETN